jgi:hypothetical protein
MAPMYLLCQEGKNSHFLTVNQAENQKPRKLMHVKAAQRSGAPEGLGLDRRKRRGILRRA